MRDRWYYQLPVSWFKLDLKERGLLTTIWSQGDKIEAMWNDVDTMLGNYWKTIADKLVKERCIEMTIVNGAVTLKLNLRTKKRRAYMRAYKRSSTKIGANREEEK